MDVYSVYVVELDEAASATGKPCVYVGQTWHTPEQRFANHKSGYKASRVVRKHGVCLRPDLSHGIGPFASRDEAQEAEGNLAASLRAVGYEVRGGH